MKICLVGPGILSIPPPGWGAVEILIWDYYNEIKTGNNVTIINKKRNSANQSDINSSYCQELIAEINNGNYDLVHIHYDVLFHISQYLTCKHIAITSHYPYIDNKMKIRADKFTPIFNFMINNTKYLNFMLAQKDVDYLIANGANPNQIIKMENGINTNLFRFETNPTKKNKTIYLGKIDDRKNQHLYQNINCIDFVGPCACSKFDKNAANYLGSWTRNEVFNNLTEYANLVLLSSGEADPVVVKEAMVCGLGVVLNYSSSKNLQNLDFITIIPEQKLTDMNFVESQIELNRAISLNKREEIKKYAIEKYSMKTSCEQYLNHVQSFFKL